MEGDLLPKLASGFGGGIGRKGSLCGALTGSVMAVGMRFGRTDPNDREAVLMVYQTCQDVWNWFEQEMGNVNCHELIGIHIDNEEERQRWLAQGGPEKCAGIVEKTAEWLSRVLEKTS